MAFAAFTEFLLSLVCIFLFLADFPSPATRSRALLVLLVAVVVVVVVVVVARFAVRFHDSVRPTSGLERFDELLFFVVAGSPGPFFSCFGLVLLRVPATSCFCFVSHDFASHFRPANEWP